ncbi:histidine phosphatase family protein [Patescibacteria group bacterium]|nr:histidine phosphatase family protein [Patescibacteria group bacterium]
MKTIIYFMRHGEVYNPKRILYGRMSGFRLSEYGRESVKLQAENLKKRKINFIYASPMLRTRQSAKILSEELGIKVKISSFLNEVKLIFEGMPLMEYKSKIQPSLYENKYYLKGQESVESIAERMTKFLKMIEKRHNGQETLVVSHGDPIVILKAEINNIPFTWKYKKDNYLKTATFTTLEIKDGRYNWK